MTQTINVGIDTNQFDQFLYLPQRYTSKFLKGEYLIAIHHCGADQKTPRLYNSSFELLNSSIDVHLHPAASALNSISPLNHHVSMQLWEKPTQLSFLTDLRANGKLPHYLSNFYVQKYVCVIPDSERQQAKRQFSQMQELGERFILRPNLGANGLGVKIISGDLIPKTIDELNSVDWITRMAQTQEELDKYSSVGFHFCEYIEDATEIRIVSAADRNIISANRGKFISETSNSLALGRVRSDYHAVLLDTLDGLPIRCDHITEMIEILKPMQKAGSYDFWVREDGTFGLYEFSTQFALNCCEPELRTDFMKFYLESLISSTGLY